MLPINLTGKVFFMRHFFLLSEHNSSLGVESTNHLPLKKNRFQGGQSLRVVFKLPDITFASISKTSHFDHSLEKSCLFKKYEQSKKKLCTL